MNAARQTFPSAPMGGRVTRGTAVAFGVVVLVTLVDYTLAAVGFFSRGPKENMIVVMVTPFLVLGGLWLGFRTQRARVASYVIEDSVLVVAKKRFPLKGLVSAQTDRDVMSWALRLFGNGGLGAIIGWYWSRRLGRFQAYLSTSENAVVLRWPDRTVAVTPADTEGFLRAVRIAAELPQNG